jgi:hypothetical protein
MRSLEHDGYNWVLRCIDVNTDHAISIPQKGKTALTTGQNLAQIWAMQGCPSILQMDNGGEFQAETQRIALQWSPGNVLILRGRPRHPQSQGKCERSHGPFKVNMTAKCTCTLFNA